MTSDTPRTDAVDARWPLESFGAMTALACQLERELAAANARAEQNEKDSGRYHFLRECLFWRTDPFANDTGARGIGYWQTKLFKLPNAPSSREQLDAAIDAAIAARKEST